MGSHSQGIKKFTYCKKVNNLLRHGKVFPVGIVRGGEIYFRVADPGCLSRPRSDFFHPGSRITIKEFKYFNRIKWFLRSRKYDSVVHPISWLFTHPGSGIQGSKGTGSRILIRNTDLLTVKGPRIFSIMASHRQGPRNLHTEKGKGLKSCSS